MTTERVPGGDQKPATTDGVAPPAAEAPASPPTTGDSKVQEFLSTLNNDELAGFRKLAREMTAPAFEDLNTKLQKRVSDADKRARSAERQAAELADEETREAWTSSSGIMDSFKAIAERLGIPGVKWISRPQDLQEAISEHLSTNPSGTPAQSAAPDGVDDPLEAAIMAKLGQLGIRSPANVMVPTNGTVGGGDTDAKFLDDFGQGRLPATRENLERVNKLTGGDKPLVMR